MSSLEIPAKLPTLTYRESKVVTALIDGKTEAEAFRLAGFGEFYATHANKFPAIEAIRNQVALLTDKLVEHAFEEALVDAGEIHDYLTRAVRADMRDIRNDDGSFKPQNEWPPIWGQMMEAGDCEIEKLFERSQDGEEKGKRGGWDQIGTVTKVKLKFGSKVKYLELAMKHKGVNAMVQEKTGDVHLHLQAEITEKLQAAMRRKERVIEAIPQNT